MSRSAHRKQSAALLHKTVDPYLPSEHTAALLLHLRQRFAARSPGRVAEIGTGSGVLLTMLMRAGAASGFGVDVEPSGVDRTASLLHSEGLSLHAEVAQGSMWEPCRGRSFDLVVANLPHFPATSVADDMRPLSWSSGGADGRRWLDEFLTGLRDHLLPDGSAVITHNAFVDLDRSRALAKAQDLVLEVLHTTSALIPAAKVACISPSVLARFDGHGIYRIGPHAFGDFHIIELRHPVHA